MINFDIKNPDTDAFEKMAVEANKRVLMKSMFKMEELAISNAPVNQGELRSKITLFPQLLSDKYTLTSAAPYSAAMEEGTRPFYAPIKPLKDWAKLKLGDEDLGYAIRAKIAKFGIQAHPYMRPAFFEVTSFWIPEFKQDELNKLSGV